MRVVAGDMQREDGASETLEADLIGFDSRLNGGGERLT